MKKSLILLSICSAVLLTSCGTSSYYASSAFEDGIYYRPSYITGLPATSAKKPGQTARKFRSS